MPSWTSGICLHCMALGFQKVVMIGKQGREAKHAEARWQSSFRPGQRYPGYVSQAYPLDPPSSLRQVVRCSFLQVTGVHGWRLRSWYRHEQQTIRMALATYSHHSAPRRQTKARAPGGGRPAPLSEVAGRQGKVERHVVGGSWRACTVGADS